MKDFLIEKDHLLISNPHHSTAFWAFVFSFQMLIRCLMVFLSGGKNTSVYININKFICMGICICLCASVTPTWSINESVTTEEDVNIDDEKPKEKKEHGERAKKKRNVYMYHKSRFVCRFLLKYRKKRTNS